MRQMVSTSTDPSLANRLTWVEPKGFRKAELRGAWKSVARMAAAAIVVAAVVVCVAIWVDLGIAAARATVIAAGAIVVGLTVVWGLSHVTRITVKVTGKAIVWNLGDLSTAYRFGAIDHCEIDDPRSGSGVPTLAVVLRNGDREVLGVAPSISPDILRATLEQRGVSVTRRLDPAAAMRVLFVCTENSNRSQMAEAFARMHGAGVLDPASAGSRPSGEVSPRAVAAMRARGYDLITHTSKGLDAVGPDRWDYVITMGCGDVCPWVPAWHREDWGLPDPRDLSDAEFDATRDEIERRVLDLIRRVRAST